MAVTETLDASEMTDRVESRLEALGAPEQSSEPWRISGRETADWAARKRAKAIRELEVVRADSARQRNEIMEAIAPYLFPVDTYEREESERLQREVSHWEAKLAEYHRDQLREDDRLKTITLPHAVLHSRKQPERWEFGDDFLSWAKSTLPGSVRTKEEIDKATVKSALKAAARTDEGRLVGPQGEIIPGLTVLPGDIHFTIESGAEL